MATNTGTGKLFERKIHKKIENILRVRNTLIKSNKIIKNNNIVGNLYGEHKFYTLLKNIGIDFQQIIKSKILADQIIYNIKNNTFYIIEMRHMHGPGSTYKKFGNWEFEIEQFNKMLKTFDKISNNKNNFKIEYIFILNNYHKKEKYEQILAFIQKRGCKVYFEDEIEAVLDYVKLK